MSLPPMDDVDEFPDIIPVRDAPAVGHPGVALTPDDTGEDADSPTSPDLGGEA